MRNGRYIVESGEPASCVCNSIQSIQSIPSTYCLKPNICTSTTSFLIYFWRRAYSFCFELLFLQKLQLMFTSKFVGTPSTDSNKHTVNIANHCWQTEMLGTVRQTTTGWSFLISPKCCSKEIKRFVKLLMFKLV